MSRRGCRRTPPFDAGLRPGPGPRRPSGSPARRGSGSDSGRGHPEASSGRLAGAATPSEREARDFRGAEPQTYPTSCSLCNACVMSAENWTAHINSGRHADGQLGLLQRFPAWDCRMETLDRADRQSERRTGKDGGPLRRTRESARSRPATSSERKGSPRIVARSRAEASPRAFQPAQRGKVACVKFAAGSVDEPHLRKLTEPFGTVARILMFPSLAFVELESAEQARELVQFHKRRPPTASARRLDFSISGAFSFVKSSRVVSFAPPPQSDDDKSDLLAVVKRFGAPVYTLFRRSKACVEMKSLEDAEKLVNYYSSANLRLNDKVLRVSFAAETSTLRSAASARRYREESTERTGSGEEDRVPEESEERRAEGHGGGSGSRSRKSRTGSPPCGEREARSGSREKTCPSAAPAADAEKPETAASGGGERQRSDVDADSERDGSDIEGMAVLGEDLEDDDLETEERMPKGDGRQVEGGSPQALPGADGGKRDEGRRPGNAAEEETSDEEAFSEDGVTSDKAGRERSGAAGEGHDGGSGDDDEDERHASRVVYFKNLPLSYCNAGDFVKLAKGLGTPVRYHLMRRLQKGFLELSRSREAVRVVDQLNVYFENTRTLVLISNKYRRLPNGLAVPRGERRRRRNSRRERGRSEDKGESKAGSEASSESDRGKENKARETPERDDATGNPADVLSRDGPRSGKAPPVTSDAGKNTTRDGNAHGGQSKDEEAPQNKSEAGKTPDTQSDDGATPEAASRGGKTARVKPEGGETPRAKETQSEGRHTLRDESKARKRRKEESESQIRNSLQRESKSRKTGECGGTDSRREDNSAEARKRSASPEVACVRGKIQKEEQRSQTSAEADENQEARGTSGTPASPLRPVGTEFVRPVVGYFCNLCQVIYADEDEAKVRHCSSRQHHFKYREKMKSAT